MCAICPWFLSFFSTPTLLTWLLFSWLIPLLFLSYSSCVARRPHSIHSFSSVLPFPPVPFFFPSHFHYLASTQATEAQCSGCLRSIWLSSPYIQQANMFAPTMSVHKVYLWLPARVVKYKITGQREPELHCSSKKPNFRGFILFRGRREEFN